MNHPKFAVVGHPNKGKSSIVASLSFDDTVAISNVPGTTNTKRSYALRVDGEIIYELYDTPGFQRARKVLSWLEQHDVDAHKKQEVVKEFVIQHKNDPAFHDEIELLEPILDGAGIIYVVDASKPYSNEYEAEMEILRWCNKPSMALINHIDDDDFTQEWKNALGHYFKLIRTYNPMEATFYEHKYILQGLAQLNEEWLDQMQHSIEIFETFYKKKIQKSAQIISDLITSALQLRVEHSIQGLKPTQEELTQTQERYKQKLRNLEHQAYEKIATILQHTHLDKELFAFPFEEIDLFSTHSASIFGLSKKELLLTTATSGALTGASVDLLLAGHTGFLGAMVGGVVGGLGGYIGFEELFKTKILGKRVGSYSLQIGPMENKNFPYILLGRALYFTRKLLHFSHAKREKFTLENMESYDIFDEKARKELEKYHKLFRSKKLSQEQIKEYEVLITQLLEQKIS